MSSKANFKSISKIHTIVFIVTGFPPEVSGTSIGSWERIQWFAKQGIYRVVVFAPKWENMADWPQVSNDLKNSLIIERYDSKPWLIYELTHVPKFFAACQINQKLPQYKPDMIVLADIERMVFFSTWQLPGRWFARQNHIPYITHYHTDYYNFARTYPSWWWLRDILIRPLINLVYRQVDTTICSTSSARESLQQVGISKNVHTTAFVGIDISAYSPRRRNRKWLEPWLNIDEYNNKLIIYLGRLGPEKRIDLLLEAFANLRAREQHNCSLLIAGDGPSSTVKQLKKIARQIPCVHFTGFLHGETKANVLASCDVFCLPSPYETFGRVVVEAMASGIPVVAINSGAVVDYITNEVNGYLVPTNNVKELTNKLQKVLMSNNEKIVHNALQDVQQFSVERGCQRLNDYYQHLLSSKPSPQLARQ
jgi:phosphatidylinositol alpha 1,6-mannosyltransferase